MIDLASPGMDRPKDYKPGDRVPGTVYRVVRKIGSGGMGTVYDVEDTTVGKRYVLKTLHPELCGRKDLVARMETEARTLARLTHPNIVEVVTAGATTDEWRLPYYVMEKLNGQNLRTILEKKGSLEIAHALHIEIDLLDALDNAHDKGVLHRDVKPDNLFLHRNPNGVTTTKLLDFGIMRLLDAGPGVTAGRFMGTLRYAAPEQLRGESLSAQADLYAAGLVLYEMIAGVGPFDDLKDPNKIAAAHLHSVPPEFTSFGIAVPEAVERLVRMALSKEASKRPKDAFTFAAQLRNVKRALAAGRIADSVTSRPTEVPIVGPLTEVPLAAGGLPTRPSTAMTPEPQSPSQMGLAATEQARSGPPTRFVADSPASTGGVGGVTASSGGTLAATQSFVTGAVDRNAATHTAVSGEVPRAASAPSTQTTTLRISPVPGDWHPTARTLRMTPSVPPSTAPDADVEGQLIALLPQRDSSPSRTDTGASKTVLPTQRARTHPAVVLGLGATAALAVALAALSWGLVDHAGTPAAGARALPPGADSIAAPLSPLPTPPGPAATASGPATEPPGDAPAPSTSALPESSAGRSPPGAPSESAAAPKVAHPPLGPAARASTPPNEPPPPPPSRKRKLPGSGL
jgi:serine/threonine-protein kinase